MFLFFSVHHQQGTVTKDALKTPVTKMRECSKFKNKITPMYPISIIFLQIYSTINYIFSGCEEHL